MSEHVHKMRPIWFFVGIILAVMGAIILGTGLYDLFAGVDSKTVLARLHPGVWWGGLMVVAGLLFIFLNRKDPVE
jgi:uncharacterized membrane protein YdbT with pleckstrin-like domain